MWAPAPKPPLLRQHDTGGNASRTGRDALAVAGVISPDAKLTILRQSASDVGFREIFISIDGTPLGMLRFGDTLVSELSPGPHSIRAHNTLFWKTVRFAVEPGEHLEFILINRAGPLTMAFMAIMGSAPLYLSIKRRSLV